MKYTLLLFFALAGPSTQDSKLPLPSAAEQKKAETEIRSVFKDEFSRKDRDSKVNLARRLLAEADDQKNTAISRYAVLLLSKDLAIEGLDPATIFAGIERLEKLYEVAKAPLAGATFVRNVNALKVEALNKAQKSVASAEDGARLGEAYLQIAEDALRERLFDDALTASQIADRYARSSKAPSVQERASGMAKEIPELRKEEDEFGRIINTKADDPTARLIRGRYCLFVVGDEPTGLENLLECSDDGLKNLARLETAKPAAADKTLELAEAWLALSGKEDNPLHKRRYADRAFHWFEISSKNAGGIIRTKIEKRLAELYKITEPSPAGLLGRWLCDEGAGSQVGDSSGKGNHGTITGGVKWVTGISGSALAFDGSTGYVLAKAAGFPALTAAHSVAWAYQVSANPSNVQVFVALRDEPAQVGLHPLFGQGKIIISKFGNLLLVSAPPPAAGEWHYLAYTFDGKTHRLYVDGNLRDSSTVPPQAGIPKHVDIGRWGGAPPNYGGLIDEIRMYSRVLTEQEVRGLVRKRK